jgi:hypothetical protein
MPLAEDGQHGDGIFGAIVYPPNPRDFGQAALLRGEIVIYYPLS